MSGGLARARTRLKAALVLPLWFKLSILTVLVALALSASNPGVLNPKPVNLSFTITGVVPALLAPDATVPMDLSLTNPNHVSLSITRLTARLDAVSGGVGECSMDNFRIDQYSDNRAIAVAASSTRSLRDLDVPVARWPQLTMINRPVNQDGCKSATIAIRYTAEGMEARR